MSNAAINERAISGGGTFYLRIFKSEIYEAACA